MFTVFILIRIRLKKDVDRLNDCCEEGVDYKLDSYEVEE